MQVAEHTRPHLISTDAEALAAAERLAFDFAEGDSARDRDRSLPWQELDRFVASGLWGITVPKEHGGAGVSAITLARVIAIIAAADGSLGQIPQNHYYALEILRVGGTERQKAFFYERVLAGERWGNALAEIGHKDFKRRTRLIREGGGLYVEGRKFYCTGALYAHRIPTLVVAEEETGRVTYIAMIPSDAPGVSIVDDWDGFGQRITGSGSVVFDHVAVEHEWLLPFQASFDRPTTIGPFAQIMHAAIDLGIGWRAYRDMLAFLRGRSRPWIDAKVDKATDDPLTIHQVGTTRVRLRAAEALLDKAGRFVDAAQAEMTESSVAAASIAVAEAKILCTKAGLLATNKLFELAGTSAAGAVDNLDRHWRNVRTHTLHDPVRWKYQAVGRYFLNNQLPPRHGVI